ncbi:hypothetical protein SAMN05421805_119139 [Saccharopolyspora antimicrobica]|uniref:Uncharacterized protein n=1 Tax=Saccharopolyspora antimicrobica TaxID=455193 RepID=A0A1I5ISQ5_9PSEU|nr:hypothetical protein [Saccharopolyspora antimicrobica]RKT84156.1 hypothetical protein ATL45_2460 [Saccharopolyspora antimicrobica]SFO63449.1 hypothetical protein SAMN05421805_119139 [Saccharopolyspora antimicrobica]
MLNPCIKPSADSVQIWLDVTSLEPVAEYAMDVWLVHTEGQQDQRDAAHHCQTSFTEAGQTYRCETTVTPPVPGHHYAAAAGGDPGTGSTVPAPGSGYVGSQSGDVLWPPLTSN